jgi:hypothetical protein
LRAGSAIGGTFETDEKLSRNEQFVSHETRTSYRANSGY